MRKKRKQHRRKKANSRFFLYLFFAIILTALSSSIFLIFYWRAVKASHFDEPEHVAAFVPTPPPPEPKKILIPSKIRLASEAILDALNKRNLQELAKLLKNVKEPACLYNYKYETKSHIYNQIFFLKCVDSFKLLLETGLINVDQHALLHKTIAHFRADNTEATQTRFYDVLLKNGADIEYVNEDGLTPLAEAVKQGNLVALTFLLKKGAVLNRPFPQADSILHYFVDLRASDSPYNLSKKSREILVRLLRAGANVFHLGKDGCNPFHRTILTSNNAEILKTFLEVIPSGFNTNQYKKTLLNYPISPETVDEVPELPMSLYTYTPLHLAVYRRDPLLATKLLKYGADPKAKDGNGLTAFDHAKIIKHPELINVLK